MQRSSEIDETGCYSITPWTKQVQNHLVIPDRKLDKALLERFFAFVDQARAKGQIIYVHDLQGTNKSTAMVSAYLLYLQKIDKESFTIP